jgi:hypothetical protein
MTTGTGAISNGSAKNITARRTLSEDELKRELQRAYNEGDLDDDRLADISYRLEQLGLGHLVAEVCHV